LAIEAGRLLQTLLYGVKPHDPLVAVSAAALIAVLCAISCGLPARQACQTDAAQALRDEQNGTCALTPVFSGA